MIGHFDKEVVRDLQNYLSEIEKLMALIMEQHSFTHKEFLPMLSFIEVKCSIESQLRVESDIS